MGAPNFNQKKENYFTRNIQMLGEDFLARKTSQDLQRDAKNRIFKDIVYGNIDYTTHGKYFMDSRFLNQLLTTAQEEVIIHNTYKEALRVYDISNPGNMKVRELYFKESNVEVVLIMLVNCLSMVKESNFDIGYITGLSQTISSQCKKSFSEFY